MKTITGAHLTDEITPLELENRQIARRAAAEGIVLLKNNGALPLKPGKIALFGAGARHTVKGGTGSGDVNERYSVNIYDGLLNAGFEISGLSWLNDYDVKYEKALYDHKHRLKLGRNLINSIADGFQIPFGRIITDNDIFYSFCETGIYVVSRQAGEALDKRLDKHDFNLSPLEKANIEKLSRGFKNSILIINSGSYMDLEGLEDRVSALIWFCQQGCEGGNALADIITGKTNPSGRLSDSWALSYEDIPYGSEYSYLKGSGNKEYYREGIYVGYRYFETAGLPCRFPFGFGLSYSSFRQELLSLSKNQEGAEFKISVKNTGNFSGKETVQLYCLLPSGELEKEKLRLTAFGKTPELKPGESFELELKVPLKNLSSYSEKLSSWLLEKGEYIFCLGKNASELMPSAKLVVEEALLTEKCRPVCPLKENFQQLSLKPAAAKSFPSLPSLSFTSADVNALVNDYSEPELSPSPLLNSLKTNQLIRLCIGAGREHIPNPSGIYTPGTVGRTSGILSSRGLPNLNLSDGPAGLRILKESSLGVKGKKLYQFATAFPVETALAQSWNQELCREVGRAIALEMEEYKVSFFLAPAMNIHRNPLCGRNFEYLSEDPLLTGKIAAAIVRGVQSVPGKYATVKHFACNNCEDNRNHSDSCLSERALREIYLRGFEICVKEGSPLALMTSYNLINGVYTPNSPDLCTAVLRCEWGFEGLVMTDWYSTIPGCADPAECIASGNDLLMPGLSTDYLSIVSALASGKLKLSLLKLSASRIIKAIESSGF